MAVNPNWPTLFVQAAFGYNTFYAPFYLTSTPGNWTDLTDRLYRQWSARHGKQFELDTVQAAEFDGQWRNGDGYLDPSNAASPFAPGVLPFRGYRVYAQWPPSVNLLTADQATGGEGTPLPPSTNGPAYGVTTGYGSLSISVAASATAYQGTQVWQTLGTTAASGSPVLAFGSLAVRAAGALSYTFSGHLRSVTTSANPVVQISLSWIGPTGTVISTTTGSSYTLTGSPTATWTAVSISGTVPAGAVSVNIVFTLTTAPSGTWSLQADGLQFEQNSSASAFVVPGTIYPVFSGLVERYPQMWEFTGTYGAVTPICVDTMAMLSQMILDEAFIMDVSATGPAWFYPLNDPSDSVTFAEQAGRFPPASLFVSGYGAGTVTAGNSITATTIPGGEFLGTGGPIVTFDNSLIISGGTTVNLSSAGITGPPGSGGWSRMLALRTTMTSTATLAAATGNLGPLALATGAAFFIEIAPGTGSTMNMLVSLETVGGAFASIDNTLVAVNDGNWHLMVFTLSSDGKTLTLYVDGVSAATTVGTDMHTSGTAGDAIGGAEYLYSQSVNDGTTGYIGDLAQYAHWNTTLSSGQVASLYTSWRTAWQGDTSGQRYSRILGWSGYAGASSIDTGVTTEMGPAGDIIQLDSLTALQNVVDTESGRHFVARDGTVTFQSRAHLSTDFSPVWTFGENAGGGELPYSDIAFDFDPTRLANNVTVTQVNGDLTYPAVDAASTASYGTRTLTRNNQSTDNEEVRESAFWYLSRYKQPQMRIQKITIDAASNPSVLFPAVLAFELGQRVRVNRRSPLAPMITVDGYIEQITHTADDQASWATALEISPAPLVPYGVFTTLRTTLHASATSGTNTISVTAFPDAATNVLASNWAAGQVLILDYGFAAQETVTIAVGGVPTTSLGYTSATLTLTANLAQNHSNGAVVCEQMGAFPSVGYWDPVAVFDSVEFSY